MCYLNILEKLFGNIKVPEAVWEEVAITGKPGTQKIVSASFINVEKIRDRALAAFLSELIDQGESEAIVLALEAGADIVLLDDRDARHIAKRFGIPVMGTLGILALAKERGLIPEIKPVLKELIKHLWNSDEIIKKFLKEVGED